MHFPDSKLLFVDDEPEILNFLVDAFRMEGYEVHTAQTGQEAIQKAREDQPNLIILDIMMPDMDGFQVIKVLRDEMNIPIIFLSARQSDVDKVVGFGLGADDYVEKPFSVFELKARVSAHLRRMQFIIEQEDKRILKQKILVFGDLQINLNSYKVHCYSKEIPLTNREFEIVKVLALNAGQTFSREQIYQLVWEDDALGYSDTVTEHIKKIRKKLLKYNDIDYIQTVWGVGYKWIALTKQPSFI